MEPRKFVVPEFVLGRGARNLAGQYAVNLGARKPLLVTDPGLLDAGWAQEVGAGLADAGLHPVTFAGVTPNPKDVEVAEGAALYLQEGCDVIVAVGGGSPMDCAKCIGIVATSGQNVLELEGVDRVGAPGPPLICIPTTAGSAADVSQFAIITDTGRRVKIAIISKAVVPDVALVDPETTATMPAHLTAATGIDALVHAVEAYVSNASSPITDLQALEAVRQVAAHLRGATAEPGDLAHRDGMMLASLLAGLAFSNASLGMVHAMAHSLGGLLDLPHGHCNAILLEHVVAFNYRSASTRYGRVAEALGVDVSGLSEDAACGRLVEALAALRRDVGIMASLQEMGVAQSDLPGLARHAHHDPCLVTNPAWPSIEDIERVYQKAC